MKEKLKFEPGILQKSGIAPSEVEVNMVFPEDPNKVQYSYDVDVLLGTDESGRPEVERRENIIADSDASLASIFALCNQQARIVAKRKIDSQKINDSAVTHVDTDTCQASQSNEIQETTQKQNSQITQVKCDQPKFIKVSGIDIKIVGETVYQKQWVKATDEESSKIRVINTPTNRIMNMTNRHIEVEKWVLVDNAEN